jgi:hypothetical protein
MPNHVHGILEIVQSREGELKLEKGVLETKEKDSCDMLIEYM